MRIDEYDEATRRESIYLLGSVDGVVRRVRSETLVADHLSALLSDLVGTNGTSAQALLDPAQDTLTLAADSTYLFDGFFHLVRAAGTTSHTTSLLFGGTATYDAIRYLAQVTNPTGNTLAKVQPIVGAAATAVVRTAANTSATENLMIWINGVLRTASAGTLIPQFQYSSAPGGAPTIRANSYFRASRVGTDQFKTLGAWA